MLAVKGSAVKEVPANAYCPIKVMFSGKTTVAKLEQLLKVLLGTREIPVPNVADKSPVQPSKIPVPMLATLLGIVTDVIALQLLNAPLFNAVMLLFSGMSFNTVHEANALAPMVVTEGHSMLLSCEQELKV